MLSNMSYKKLIDEELFYMASTVIKIKARAVGNNSKAAEVSEVVTKAAEKAEGKTGFQKFMENAAKAMSTAKDKFNEKAVPVLQNIGKAIGKGAEKAKNFVNTKAQHAFSDLRVGAKAFAEHYTDRQSDKNAQKIYDKMQKLDAKLSDSGYGNYVTQMSDGRVQRMTDRVKEACEKGIDPQAKIMQLYRDSIKQVQNIQAVMYEYGAARLNGATHDKAVEGIQDQLKQIWEGQKTINSYIPSTDAKIKGSMSASTKAGPQREVPAVEMESGSKSASEASL